MCVCVLYHQYDFNNNNNNVIALYKSTSTYLLTRLLALTAATASTGVVLGRQNISSLQGPSKYGCR